MDGPHKEIERREMKVVFLISLIASAKSWPIDVAENEPGNLWIPNLRDSVITGDDSREVPIPLNYKVGEVVAELTASSGFSKESPAVHTPVPSSGVSGQNGLDYEICKDPGSKITMYHLDNFKVPENDRKRRPVTVRNEVFHLGRFDRGGKVNNSPFLSVKIEGKCCWETFTEVDFGGKMLRLCRGKYNSSILGRMAGNIRSLRPVDHFKN